eukprot:g74477.t1
MLKSMLSTANSESLLPEALQTPTRFAEGWITEARRQLLQPPACNPWPTAPVALVKLFHRTNQKMCDKVGGEAGALRIGPALRQHLPEIQPAITCTHQATCKEACSFSMPKIIFESNENILRRQGISETDLRASFCPMPFCEAAACFWHVASTR